MFNVPAKFNISKSFIKFILVGILNTVFGYSVFALFNFLGFHYSMSTLLSTVIGILFNFKTTGCLVFNNNNNRLLFRFIMVYCITYFFTVLVLTVLSKLNLNNMYINYAVVLPVNALLSYYLMKKIVFIK